MQLHARGGLALNQLIRLVYLMAIAVGVLGLGLIGYGLWLARFDWWHWFLISLGALWLLLHIGLIVMLQRKRRAIQQLTAVVDVLATADLSVRAPNLGTDELGELAQSINLAAEHFTNLLDTQRRETQRERAILAAIDDGVIVCDQLGQIILLNTAAYNIIAMAEAERLQTNHEQPNLSLRFYAALEAVQPALDQALGRPHIKPAERVCFAGRTYRLSANPIWIDDRRIGAVAILQDISARVESERLRSDFMALAAHELRSPLTSIRGFADMLLWSNPEHFSAEEISYIEGIGRNIQRLTELMNDVVELARLETQRNEHTPQPVDLRQVLSAVLDEFRPRAERKKLQLDCLLPNELPLLSLDPLHIRQISHHLISNAIKYTPEQGQIQIEVQQRIDDVLVVVRDTGIGISLREQPRIFGRFFRNDNPLSRAAGGTGLGLSIAKALVEMNHGSIYFESIEEEGTTFYVAFPLALVCEPLPYNPAALADAA